MRYAVILEWQEERCIAWVPVGSCSFSALAITIESSKQRADNSRRIDTLYCRF